MASLLLLVLMAGGLAGCMSRPALEHQTFVLQPTMPVNTATPKGQAIVAIRTMEVSPLFESRAFVYRTGADRYQVDPYAGFLISPSGALGIPIRDYLRQSGVVKDVVEPGSPLQADTVLEIHVTELYGDLRSGQPAAVLSMRFMFFDARKPKTEPPFLEKTYQRRIPLQEKTAAALVAGWNQALAQTLGEVTSDLASAKTGQGSPAQ